MYRHRKNFWSFSKLAKKVHSLLGAPKVPYDLSREDWQKYHDDIKENHKIAYFLDEYIWDGLQNIIYFPYDLYRIIKIGIINRFIEKNWMLDTGLNRWTYRDYDHRLLHAVFNSFCKDYCMKEKGKGSERKLYEMWKWEQSLVYDEDYGLDEGDEGFGDPTDQAIHAKKEQELFEWWKFRSAQIDIDDFVSFEDEEKKHDIDNEKLKELIDIRRGLWT